MMRLLAIATIGIISFGQAAAMSVKPSSLAELIDPAYADNEHWYDGKAEVAAYDAEAVIYGKTREFTAHLITVTEDFNTDYMVKADWPYGDKPIMPVIKQNFNCTIETDNYPYHFMSSLFVDALDFRESVKLSISSQEWCGITSKQYLLWKDQPEQVYQSYWDGEGIGQRDLSAADNTYFEEELPLLLRALNFKDDAVASFQLYVNQTTSKAREPRTERANMDIQDRDDHWMVRIVTHRESRRIIYHFAKEYPHQLLRMEHSDGRKLQLKEVRRWAYWE